RPARFDFFQSETGPFKRVAGRKVLARGFLHGIERLARAVAGSGTAIDLRSAEKIVMADHVRTGGFADCNDAIQGHHLAALRAYIEFPQIVGARAELRVGLNVNPIRTIVEVEIVHILGSHENLQCRGDLREGYPKALGFFAVDLNHKLRVAGTEAGKQSLQFRASTGLANQVARHAVKVFQSTSSDL